MCKNSDMPSDVPQNSRKAAVQFCAWKFFPSRLLKNLFLDTFFVTSVYIILLLPRLINKDNLEHLEVSFYLAKEESDMESVFS